MKSGIFIAVLLLCASVHAAYGVKWKPGDTNAVAGAYLVADSAFEMRMRQPDGKERVFHRDFDEPNKLYGDDPWVGEDLGGQTFTILTNPNFKGGRTGYVFQNGHLRRMILGRKDYSFDPMEYPKASEQLETLWPKDITKDEAKKLFSTWKDGGGRWRLGYSNPNKGGFLCAELALAALLAAFLCWRRKWLSTICALGACGAFYAMLRTESRSALVAFVVGVLTLSLLRFKSRLGWKWLASVAGILAVGLGIIVLSGRAERFTTKLVDAQGESDAQRISVWKAAPRMMIDSPCGWGLGNSGTAYTCWYQPPTEFKIFRTLVNSHLTWLVEFGWAGRFLYLTALAGACLFLLFLAWRGASPLPAAMLCSFATAGLFNSVMEAPTLWILPVASLATLVKERQNGNTLRFAWVSLAAGAVLSALVLTTLAVIGIAMRQTPALRATGSRVVVNGKAAKTWVVDDGVVLGRGFIGKELRMFYAAFPDESPLGFVWSVEDVPRGTENIVLAGKKGVEFLEVVEADPALLARFESITFISPPFEVATLPDSILSHPKLTVYRGELAERHTSEDPSRHSCLRIVPGARLYIPGWMRLAADLGKTPCSTTQKQEDCK